MATDVFARDESLIDAEKKEFAKNMKRRLEVRECADGQHQENDVSNDEQIEQEIQAKGLTAPRITMADIEANIASEHYFTAEDGVGRANKGQTSIAGKNPVALSLLTFCVLVLRNGFTVTGESACASPENFDAEIGRRIARQNAVDKVWPLMGYALREQLHQRQ